MSHARDLDACSDDASDLLITASFLCIPIASLLWSILTFTLAIASYCIQNLDRIGRILLPIILGVVVSVVGGFMLSFANLRHFRRKEGGVVAGGIDDVGMSAVVNGPGNFAGGV